MAILRCCRLKSMSKSDQAMDVLGRTHHLSSYCDAVIALPRRITWFFMKYFLRVEKMAPLVTNKSRATWGSEITTKSWFPIHTEKSDPYFFAHAWSERSGSPRRKAYRRRGPGGIGCPSLSTTFLRKIYGNMASSIAPKMKGRTTLEETS